MGIKNETITFSYMTLKGSLSSKTVNIIKGVGAIVAAYGIYKIWSYLCDEEEEDEYFEKMETCVDPSRRRVLIIGLDGAGKTRFARSFCKGRRRFSTLEESTVGFYVNSVTLGSIYLNMWDVGGSRMCRNYWSKFILDIDAICFLVDSTEPNRFEEARQELHKFLYNEETKGIPLVIIATKQDEPSAVTPAVVLQSLQLDVFHRYRHVHLLGIQAPDSEPRKGFMKVYRLFVKLSRERHKLV